MSQQALINHLVTSLSELDTKLTQLSQTLLQEQTALSDKHFDNIQTLADEKITLTQGIELAEQSRVKACAELNISPDKAALGKWLKTQPKIIQQHIAKLWKRITFLGQKCATQNQINGILVAHQHRHAQDALCILRGVAGPDDYSEKGKQDTQFSHNVIGKV